MDEFTANIFSKPLPISPEAVCVYFCMRSDIARNETVTSRMLKSRGQLVSGLDVQTIAQRCGLSSGATHVAISELLKKQWIRSLDDITYQLGEKEEFEIRWFANVEEKPPEAQELTMIDQIRGIAAEKKAREKSKRVKISTKAKRKVAADTLGGLVKNEKGSTIILNHISEEAWKRHNENPIFDNTTKYVYAGRFLLWCGEDVPAAKELVTWAFDNWDRLKDLFRLRSKCPEINHFATKSICDRMANYFSEGIPSSKVDKSGLATRANSEQIDEAKDEGW